LHQILVAEFTGVWKDSSQNQGVITSYTFTNITSNHTLRAAFVKVDTVFASAGANGSISPSGATPVDEGSDKTFTITPATGYHVSDVLVDGSSVGAVPSYTFSSVTANHTINATFAINTYVLTSSAGSNGSVTPSGSTTKNYGDNLAISIVPTTGYHVSDVIVDGSSVGSLTTYTFSSIAANHTLVASFAINTYTITATAGSNGSVAPTGGSVKNYGDNETITITPSTGYHIADVTVDGSSVGAVSTYTFSSISANHTISATFAINTFTIYSAAGANGSISPSGTTTKNYGDNQTIAITPDAHYHVLDVTVDGSSVGAVTSYTFSSIAANHTISVTFTIDTYNITASTGPHGTISPIGVTVVPYGGSQSYAITPDSAYQINQVNVNGTSIGNVSTYTFSGVAADQTIDVVYSLIPIVPFAPNTDVMCAGAVHTLYCWCRFLWWYHFE
jgi:hypothetical protein